MAKQIKVSPSDGERELIQKISEAWSRTDADLVLDGFRRSMASLMHDYEVWERIRKPPDRSDVVLRSILIRMAAGEIVTDEEIIEAGYDADIDATTLKKIRDCLSQRRNGDVHVHQD